MLRFVKKDAGKTRVFSPIYPGGIIGMSSHEKIELMAPVGSIEALRAAVQNGADAIYLGGKMFSARQYAQNFDLDELKEAVRYAHLYGVKVYLAVNTLIENEEFKEVLKYAYDLYSIDVDAIIIQDLGVAYALHKVLPEIEIHASTQMTIHNSAGVRFLEKNGFDRVVLAREVSLENIKLIGKKSKMPLETFVHGALCVSYSGQCLMSSMIGGRSGNRGRCAQPCRLPYTLIDSKGNEIKAGHLLSSKDLKMIEHIPALIDAGVVALKVEGRMKRPEYVATVIRNYRQTLDNLDKMVSEHTQKELLQIFNRDFTTGYYFEKPGPQLMSYQRPNNRGLRIGRVVSFNPTTSEVTVRLEGPLQVGDGYEIWVTKGGRIGGEVKELLKGKKYVSRTEQGEVVFKINEGLPKTGDRVFKTMDIELMKQARETIESQYYHKYPLDFKIHINLGEPVYLEAQDDENKATATSTYIVEKAQKHPVSRETIEKQLQRLGNTIFGLRELVIESQEGMMVPVSELNALRRQVVEKLEAERLKKTSPHAQNRIVAEQEFNKRCDNFYIAINKGKQEQRKHQISVVVGDMPSLKAALEAGSKIIYFGGEKLRRKKGVAPEEFEKAVKACHAAKAQAILMIPRLYQEELAEHVKKYCLKGYEAGVDGYLASNLGAIQLAQELGLHGVRGDYTLNVLNDVTIRALREWGLEHITVSSELTFEQIRAIKSGGNSLEAVVHGDLPLMITEHCLLGNILGTGHREKGCPLPCHKDSYKLKDKMNYKFPIESDENCRMHIFNSKTLCLLDKLPHFLSTGIGTFRIEARKEDHKWVEKVVGVYSQEIMRCAAMGENYSPLEENQKTLQSLAPSGFTTGHYFRGVE